ncbi:cytochrome P450-like protein [Thermothelomyces thermophilus ATCC 42464]|uniref:Cytochrome P450-like protein n=1 Tax=Thermothelomyces thermophilus (strain ATCC 42464 / BCRC 31852 / DSM 1799) TaxID=573729 RepID=G2QG54_THET4|nr:cytochrome P450-like protein [Thermothelomyces thermophilus ATCC 42464]AEO58519.1 cytochrome P450-like protein [Thermothelomyces thermophilus ATCC 42464]
MTFSAEHLQLWLGLVAISGFLYTTCLVIYRLFFHPLAKYPGPFLAKLTDAYMLYYAWRGDRHLEFWRMHEKYGKFVRFGPNSLSINSNTALKDIYGFRANVRKAEFYDAFVHPAPNTHNARDKDLHARKRRVLSHAFSDGAIKEVERYILANIRTFCEAIGDYGRVIHEKKGWSSPKNMSDWCNWLAMDILGDLCFGKAFHMLDRPDNRYAVDLVGVAAQRHLLCGTMPIINKLSLDKILFHRIAAGRARYMAYSRQQLAERTALGDETDRRDFFYHLLKARDPETGQGFTTPELWGESNLLIIAGSDTTSTAMAATLFYLVRHPDALAKVTAEIRSQFASLEDIHQGAQLNACVYLRACIDEAMRLSPSVGGLLPREVLKGGMTIDGEHIPAGIIVGTPHYAIHHNPAYYPDPFAYRPERWIVGSEKGDGVDVSDEAQVALAQSAFCPFSIGPRGCIGKGLAYVEMTLTLARVLFLYDLRKAVGVADPGEGKPGAGYGRDRVGEFQLVDTFTSLKDGPMVEFRRREL